jgi:Flp pilus assembly protein TadG
MDTPMRSPCHAHERGAVALVFALALVSLLAMAGCVLDLAHLYIVKAQLQNATDSAALAGALDLDGSASGVAKALAMAQKMSSQNQVDFSDDLILAPASITFGKKQDGPWVSAGAASATPANYTFLKIDTGPRTLDTYLMRVVGIDTMRIAAQAVAGHFLPPADPGIRLHQ